MREAQPIVERLLALAEFVPVHYSWRPSSPDPGDEHVIDCAMNARAVVVTFNVKDFRWARVQLGLQVLTPDEFLWQVTENRPAASGQDQE